MLPSYSFSDAKWIILIPSIVHFVRVAHHKRGIYAHKLPNPMVQRHVAKESHVRVAPIMGFWMEAYSLKELTGITFFLCAGCGTRLWLQPNNSIIPSELKPLISVHPFLRDFMNNFNSMSYSRKSTRYTRHKCQACIKPTQRHVLLSKDWWSNIARQL